jgi:tetratricopeptide (TPR) repeat protein
MLGLGWSYYELTWLGRAHYVFYLRNQNPLDGAIELATRAIASNPSLAEPYALLGSVHFLKKNHNQSIAQLQRAVALEPGVAEWKFRLAGIQSLLGRPEEAYGTMKQALRLNPFPAEIFQESWCRILYQTGRYKEAILVAREILNRNPERIDAQIFLMASYGVLGRKAEALAEFEKYKSTPRQYMSPKLRIQFRMHFVNPLDAQRIIDDLEKAGLPE